MEAYALLSVSYVATKCHNFIMVEKSGGAGGIWRNNIYPGCYYDVWSHLYSLLFEQNPRWTWEYPRQKEILEYLISVAQKYGLSEWDDLKKWRTRSMESHILLTRISSFQPLASLTPLVTRRSQALGITQANSCILPGRIGAMT